MTLLLTIALLFQETPDDILKALKETDAVARGEAIDKIVAKGRMAVSALRTVIVKSEGGVREAAKGLIGRIATNEAAALLKKEGHAELGDLKSVTHESLTAVLDGATVHLLPGNASCKACGSVERVLVVNNFADDKGAPRLVKVEADVPAIFEGRKATSDAERKALCRAVLFLLRALHPKAHTTELVPLEDEAYADATLILLKEGKASAPLKIGHEEYIVHFEFDAKRGLTKITLEDTGMG
jgi:hypothetical protein